MAEQHPSVVIGLAAEQVPVVTYKDAYYWTCEVCGWLGTGLLSIVAAQQEAGRHVNDRHPEAGPPYTVERRDLRTPPTREDLFTNG